MKTVPFTIFIDSIPTKLTLNNELVIGNNEVLLDKEDNIIENASWNNEGYTIEDFGPEQKIMKLKMWVEEYIKNQIVDTGIEIGDQFKLGNYHHYVKTDNEHFAVIGKMMPYINTDIMGVFSQEIKERVEQICNTRLDHMSDKGISLFNIRIVRPHQLEDANPPHKDIYIDRLKNKINIYLPICGSNKYSSLSLIPGSHYWNEKDILRTKDGSVINNKKYHVQSIVSYKNEPLQLTRPNPKFNEIMVFSPYMVHGAGYNTNNDITRVSIEMRLEKKLS